MSLKTFNAVLSPKVRGTINLHEALLHEPLDFFVMTSSVIGAIGASTQSNYAAANAFMDSMARHRYSLGLQGTSIALGMVVEVGHVEAHPGLHFSHLFLIASLTIFQKSKRRSGGTAFTASTKTNISG